MRSFPFVSLLIIALSSVGRAGAKPPKEPPEEMIPQYTVDGAIPMAKMYVDDTGTAGMGSHFKFPFSDIERYINSSTKQFSRIDNFVTSGLINDAQDVPRLTTNQEWAYYSLYAYRSTISSAESVAVFGSSSPWAEAALLALNASSVVTIEYNNLTYEHPHITTIAHQDFERLYSCDGGYLGTFDIALSFSSFDHDGLGRYSDPLNPDGDLLAMRKAKSVLKPGGLMLLTVPVGPDVVVFNLHRRYGAIRLPMLLNGWEIERRFYWDDNRVTADSPNWRRSYEPVIALRKPLQKEPSDLDVCSGSSRSDGTGSSDVVDDNSGSSISSQHEL